jgi:hypothetical protein
MRKAAILFLIGGLLSFPVTGQDFSKEFGKITGHEFQLDHYAKDKTAEALVLFDVGKSYFIRAENSYDVIFERSTRIKIFSEAGIEWAEVEIPFYQEGGIYEKIYDIEAYTYNVEDGGITKTSLDVANTYDEKVSDYWNVKKFAMPNVKEGSIIEYRYKINSQYKFNLRDWEFQWKIPVLYSEYEVKMIPFYEYTYLMQGRSKFDDYSTYTDKGVSRQFGSITFQDLVHKFVMTDLPAFNDEEFITSINDYIIQIDFQLARINYPTGTSVDILTTWEKMIEALQKHTDFGKYIIKSEKMAPKLIDEKALSGKSDQEKFDAIIDFVKGNYNWNNFKGIYATKPLNKFITDKFGNCADLNLLATGLLNGIGIEAYPVLISTRSHGKIKYDYPYSHFFNYIIILAYIDGKPILSDATRILGLNDRIPAECINDRGLIIQEDKVEWVTLAGSKPSEIETILDININDPDQIARLKQRSTEYDAQYFRENFKDEETVVAELKDSRNYEISSQSLAIENLEIRDKPLGLSYETSSVSEMVNEKIYVKPFLNEVISDNPLKQQTRSYPIDMNYPKKRTYRSTIMIPEGYQIDFLPQPVKIKNDQFEMNYSVASDEEKIVAELSYYFKGSVYAAQDYMKIKYYFNEIVNKGSERVVFSELIP